MKVFAKRSNRAALRDLCAMTVMVLLFILIFVLPLAAFAAPEVETMATIYAPNVSDRGGDLTLDHLAAIASFYQTVIGILVTVIGLLATLSFITIRHLSKTAAEDMAVDAAHRAIDNSHSFREEVGMIVEETARTALDEVARLQASVQKITASVAAIDEKISVLDSRSDSVVATNDEPGAWRGHSAQED